MRRPGSERRMRPWYVGFVVAVLTATSACGPIWIGRHKGEPAGEPEKITAVLARVPAPNELPPLIGRVQHHRVKEGETLLDVARDAGLGFHELKDANPSVDEWIPPPGVDVVVPSRWILPRSRYRGLVVNIPEMRMYVFPTNAKAGELVPL